MAASGYTPISLYYSSTAAATPVAGNLVNGELAINITDGKLFYKDNGGTVKVIAGTGGTGVVAGSNTQVQFNNNGVFGASSNFTFDGTNIGLAGGTANGVAYLNGSKVLTTGSALTFDGTNLGLNTASLGTFNRGLYINSGAGAYAGIQLNNTAYPNGVYFSITNADLNIFNANSTGDTIFGVNNAEQMRLTSTGLGIGTSSPAQKLTVNGKALINGVTSITGEAVEIQGNAALGNYSAYSTSNYRDIIYSATTSSYGNQPTAYIRFQTTGDVSSAIAFATRSSPVDYAERMRLDSSGNLGLGVTPSAWGGNFVMSQYKGGSIGSQSSSYLYTAQNGYYDGSNWKYVTSNYATATEQGFGAHKWYTAPSGTAGNAISWTQAMTLDASGNLLVGTTSGFNTQSNRGNISVNGATDSIVSFGNGGSNSGYIYSYASGLEITTVGSRALVFQTNNAERMRIDSSGNVAVGTTTPLVTASGRGNITINGSTDSLLAFGNAGAVSGYIFANSSSFTVNSQSAKPIVFEANGSERMRIDSSGNVGIGTSSPSTTLDVVRSSADAYVRTSNGSIVTYYGTANGAGFGLVGTISAHPFTFYTNNSERMRIDSSGNVGIGTSSPAAAFAGGTSVGYGALDATGPIITRGALASSLTNGGAFSYYDNGVFIRAFGSSNNGYIGFNTGGGGGGDTERMRIDSSGNVGIGTNNPGNKLDVQTTLTSTTSFANRIIRVASNANGADSTIQFTDNVAYNSYISGKSGGLLFGVNGATEVMRIDSSGNLLVGTTAAGNGEKLAVIGGNGIRCKSEFTLSGTTLIGIYAGVGGMIVIRDQVHGGTCLILYENGATPIIVSQSGSNFTTGTPSGTQVKLSAGNAGASGGFGMSASMAAGQTATLGVGVFSVDEA